MTSTNGVINARRTFPAIDFTLSQKPSHPPSRSVPRIYLHYNPMADTVHTAGDLPLTPSKGIMKYFYTGRSVIIGCSDGGSSQPTLLWSTVLLQPC